MRGVFAFAIFVFPPILCLYCIFKGIFHCIHPYKISVYLRRYYFLSCALSQGLIEGNIPFFTYLFFRQCYLAFSFKFTDKIFIAIAIVLFFFVIIFVCCFYFIYNWYLEKKFGYFIYCFYRSLPAMVFLTFQLVMRGLVRGAIHSCLHNHYTTEIILLCVMEASIIVVAVWIEKKHKIFMTQLMFCLTLCYHFIFILINLSLYVEETLKETFDNEEIIELILTFQKVLVYGLLSLIMLEFILDFVPESFLTPTTTEEE